MKPDAQQKKNNEVRKVKEDGRRKVKTAKSFLNPKTKNWNSAFCACPNFGSLFTDPLVFL